MVSENFNPRVEAQAARFWRETPFSALLPTSKKQNFDRSKRVLLWNDQKGNQPEDDLPVCQVADEVLHCSIR